MKAPSVSSDAGGVFHFREVLAAIERKRQGSKQEQIQEEDRAVPISALLARIRKLIPINHEDHCEEIVRGFGNGALRPPAAPISDRELSRVIADFLKDAPRSRQLELSPDGLIPPIRSRLMRERNTPLQASILKEVCHAGVDGSSDQYRRLCRFRRHCHIQ